MDSIIKSLLQVYGPLGVLAVIGFVLYFAERKRNTRLSKDLYEVSIASIRAEMTHNQTHAVREQALDLALRVLVGKTSALSGPTEE